jgi:hypothetical protein
MKERLFTVELQMAEDETAVSYFKVEFRREVSSSHGGEYKDYSFPGRCAV